MARRADTAATIEAYIATRQAKGVSTAHVDALRYRLGKLAAAHTTLPNKPEPLEATLATLTHLAEETRRDVWAAWRALYKWTNTRHGTANPMTLVEGPPRHRRVRRTLSDTELDQLLFTTQRNHRNHALLTFFLDNGARVGELTGITWKQITRHNDGSYTATIDGKTGQRIVPLSLTTIDALQRCRRSDHLFTNRTGQPLARRGLQQIVKKALRRIGITGGPHLLRHTFGKLYLLNGGDLKSLKEIMGHARISTTETYVELDTRDIQHQHALFSPIARRAAERNP